MHHILHKGCITSYSGDASYPTHGMRHIPLKGCVISNSGHLHALLAPDLLVICLSDTCQCEVTYTEKSSAHEVLHVLHVSLAMLTQLAHGNHFLLHSLGHFCWSRGQLPERSPLLQKRWRLPLPRLHATKCKIHDCASGCLHATSTLLECAREFALAGSAWVDNPADCCVGRSNHSFCTTRSSQKVRTCFCQPSCGQAS